MKRLLALALLPLAAAAQDSGGTHELLGQLGSRATLMTLHATRNPDASWQLAGEYVILPTLQRRFVEGESSPREAAREALKQLYDHALLAEGDRVIITSGDHMEQHGATNTLRLLQVGAAGNAEGLGEL